MGGVRAGGRSRRGEAKGDLGRVAEVDDLLQEVLCVHCLFVEADAK